MALFTRVLSCLYLILFFSVPSSHAGSLVRSPDQSSFYSQRLAISDHSHQTPEGRIKYSDLYTLHNLEDRHPSDGKILVSDYTAGSVTNREVAEQETKKDTLAKLASILPFNSPTPIHIAGQNVFFLYQGKYFQAQLNFKGKPWESFSDDEKKWTVQAMVKSFQFDVTPSRLDITTYGNKLALSAVRSPHSGNILYSNSSDGSSTRLEQKYQHILLAKGPAL